MDLAASSQKVTGHTLVILFEAPLTVLKIEPSPVMLYGACRNEMLSLCEENVFIFSLESKLLEITGLKVAHT